MSYVDGFMNGTDMFLGNGSGAALDAYASSPTFAGRIRDAVRRILYTFCNTSAAMNGLSADSAVVEFMPWWQVLLTAGIAVCAVAGGLSVVLAVFSLVKDRRTC